MPAWLYTNTRLGMAQSLLTLFRELLLLHTSVPASNIHNHSFARLPHAPLTRITRRPSTVRGDMTLCCTSPLFLPDPRGFLLFGPDLSLGATTPARIAPPP